MAEYARIGEPLVQRNLQHPGVLSFALIGEPNKIRVSRWLALFCCSHLFT